LSKAKFLRLLFFLAALTGVTVIFLIFLFVAVRGLPIFAHVGLFSFIFDSNWLPTENQFGALPLIVGSFLVTLGALAIGGPLGVGVAIFLAEVAPQKVQRWVRPAVELLAGVPSVVYGFFGIMVIIPLVRRFFGGSGFGLITGSIVLGMMILPTIATLSEDALRAVPKAYKVGSLGLGASRWQTISRISIPAASQGIVTAIILGIGRAIGETMAVLMVLGNAPIVPKAANQPMTAITSVIALDMSYASGEHQTALFALGLILLIFSMLLVSLVRFFARRKQ
jgi:phosphate transport system permease protein